MTEVAALVAQLSARGVLIEATGNNLHIDAPQGVITPTILESLRERMNEIFELLSLWPKACLETERCFGSRHARLFPLIDKQVQTPEGWGILWRVFTYSAGVVLESRPQQVTFMEPEQVLPMGYKDGASSHS